MRGDRLRDAIKLNEDDALINPTFIDARRQPARQEAAARRLKRRASKLRVRSESLLVTDRAVRSNPIRSSHSFEGNFIAHSPIYVQTSFASSVISALSTLETGQFCSASCANRANVS